MADCRAIRSAPRTRRRNPSPRAARSRDRISPSTNLPRPRGAAMNVTTEQLFEQARTHNGFTTDPVPTIKLRRLYDLMKWGPTSANSSPARIVFVVSPDAKATPARVRDAGQRREDARQRRSRRSSAWTWRSTRSCRTCSRTPTRSRGSTARPSHRTTAFRNSSLQGGYFILAARAARPRLRPDERVRRRQDRRGVLGRHRRSRRTSSATSAKATRPSSSRAARACLRGGLPDRLRAGYQAACAESMARSRARDRATRRCRSSRRAPARSRLLRAPARTAPRAAGGPAWRSAISLRLVAGSAAPSPRSCSTLWRRKRSASVRAWCGCQPSSSSTLRAAHQRRVERLALDQRARRARAARSSAARCARARRSCSCGKCSRTRSTHVEALLDVVDRHAPARARSRRRRCAAGRAASRRRSTRASRSGAAPRSARRRGRARWPARRWRTAAGRRSARSGRSRR